MRALLTLLTSAAVFGGGCNHITTTVPGVLDMRSDASIVPADPSAKGGQERTGIDAIMYGDGVIGDRDVTIVDRKYWICSLLPAGNESATEEIKLGLSSGALKNVRIGEELTFFNGLVGACVTAVPLLNTFDIAMPPRDFHFWGTRIKPVPEAMAPPSETAPPPDALPAPPDPSADPAAGGAL